MRKFLLATAATLGFATSSMAADVAINKSWEGHNTKEYCYAISFPVDERASQNDRYLTVTHRPSEKIRDEIAVVSGFPEDANIEGSVRIDQNLPFKMLVYKGVGFLKSADVERMMVAQMKAGLEMEVKWTDAEGAYHADKYSLVGFTASRNHIDGCKG
ncbi:hypothetical protein [Sulfitobacter sp. R18_1]|uniref:hypothetical protein n=1 Tax=Sulfitobacter sp. R18_1 TaxID=2821104 RepID=UPI001ADC9DD7|nr:hypothetical protein [Sulfitobacter sp. R18_1]MBO9428482.1 hypothetical protein [Sulfitobacter sp. R18_1]